MKNLVKSFSFLVFVFIVSQNYTLASSEGEAFGEQGAYRLNRLYQKRLDIKILEAEVGKLIEQGFPLKRAREIYAQQQIAKVFAKKFESELLPVSKVLEKIEGTCETEFYKTDKGVLDEVFTTPDIEWLQRSNAPIVYNETHFVETVENIQPANLKAVKEACKYSVSWCSSSTLSRPCSFTSVSISFSWAFKLLSIKEILKERLESFRIGHTLTILQPDGMLTLYDVVNKKSYC